MYDELPCTLHGKKPVEHVDGYCLYCCVCFTTLTKETCTPDPVTGHLEDVCAECRRQEAEIKRKMKEAKHVQR